MGADCNTVTLRARSADDEQPRVTSPVSAAPSMLDAGGYRPLDIIDKSVVRDTVVIGPNTAVGSLGQNHQQCRLQLSPGAEEARQPAFTAGCGHCMKLHDGRLYVPTITEESSASSPMPLVPIPSAANLVVVGRANDGVIWRTYNAGTGSP